jgi:hypothetical protein
MYFDLTDDKTIHYFKGNNCPISKQRAHTPLNCRELIHPKSSLLRDPLSAWSISVINGKFDALPPSRLEAEFRLDPNAGKTGGRAWDEVAL